MKRRMSQRRWDSWGICLLCAGLCMAVGFACCHTIFETNDDSGIIAIASGAFTGSPYAGNGYTSYLYGALLQALYSVWTGMPWHTLLMLAVIFFALAAILKSMLTVCVRSGANAGFGACAFLTLVLGVFLQYVVKLQYTAVAAFAGTAGTSLIWARDQEEARRGQAASMMFAAVLLVFAYCLRSDSFWACMPLLAGNCVLDCAKRRSAQALVPALMVLLGAVALSWLDLALYRLHEPNWGEFCAIYALRRQLLDYHNTDLMQQVATQALGWPEATVKMIRNWYMLDEHMNAENLRTLLSAVAEALPRPTLGSLLKSTGSILRRYPMFAFNFAAFGLWGLFASIRFVKLKQWLSLLRIGGAMAYLLVFIAYFYGILARLPERAAFAAACPCYVFGALACLPSLSAGEKPEKEEAIPRPRPRAATLCMTLLLLGGGATLIAGGGERLPLRWRETAQTARQTLSENVRDYVVSHPSLVYVTDIPQRYDPFYAGPTAALNLVDWGHAMQGSDMLRSKMEANGFENLNTDSLWDPKVRLMISSDNLDMLLTYLQTLYPGALLETVDGGAGFNVYKLTM